MSVMEIMGPDLGKIIDLVKLKMKYSYQVFSVLGYGAEGDGEHDDTEAINDTLDAAIANGGGVVVFPFTSKFYKTTQSIVRDIPDGIRITIIGFNSEIRLVNNLVPVYQHILCLRTASNFQDPVDEAGTYLHVSGIKFNGIGVPEQWEKTDFTGTFVQLTGLYLLADHIVIEDCSFENIYGLGIQARGYVKAHVGRCDFKNVGGHWRLYDNYDAFGDSIYFGSAVSNESVASVDHCRCVGYASTKSLSRCGITFESFGVDGNRGGFAYITNTYIEGYQRGVHVEGVQQMRVFISNVEVNRYHVGFFMNLGCKSVMIDNFRVRNKDTVTTNPYGADNYNGTSGPIGAFFITTRPDVFKVSNSYFEINDDCESFLENIPIEFENCKFVSTGGKWTVKGVIDLFDTCHFYKKVLYVFACKIEKFRDCVFKGTGSEIIMELGDNTSRINKFTNCTIEDGFIQWTQIPDADMPFFDNCMFIKSAGITMTDNGFLRPFQSKALLKDTTVISSVDMEARDIDWGGVVIIGNYTKLINGVVSAYQVVTAPNNTRYKISVDNAGAFTSSAMT